MNTEDLYNEEGFRSIGTDKDGRIHGSLINTIDKIIEQMSLKWRNEYIYDQEKIKYLINKIGNHHTERRTRMQNI